MDYLSYTIYILEQMDVDKILNPAMREYNCFHACGKFINSDHILEHNAVLTKL